MPEHKNVLAILALLGLILGCEQKGTIVKGPKNNPLMETLGNKSDPSKTDSPETQSETSPGAGESILTVTPKNLVLGESDFTSNIALTGGLVGTTPGGHSSALGTTPVASIFTNGTKFVMAEPSRHRIKLWNSIPTSLANPDVVLGQDNQFSTLSNAGDAAPSASTLNAPSGVWTDGTQLIVADRGNNRVLIWNTWPTTNKQAADVVVGQADFSTVTWARTQNGLYMPYAVNVIGGKLVVSDSANYRVMVWNSVPTTNFAPADMVWGQADFVAGSTTIGTNTVYSTMSPVQYAGGKIIVASGNKSRIAFFNGIPAASNPAIEFVIGQPSISAQEIGTPECIATFTGGCAGSGGLGFPHIHSDGTRLFVSDQTYNRILVWNAIPTTASTPPDMVLGQNDFVGCSSNSGGVSASSLSFPGQMTSTSTHLYVVDDLNNRILRFPLSGLTNKASADAVLGIDSTTRGAVATTGNFWITPEGVFKLGNKLAIADTVSNRVLLYNSAPAADNVTPNVVLGQSDFVRVGANAGGVSASSLYAPGSVTLVGDGSNAGTMVIVSDTSNNRLLIWNTWPTTNKQAADLVVGQTGFLTNTANEGGLSGATLSAPAQTWSDGTRLLVADKGNFRVLYFSTFPTAPNATATWVLGQTGPTAGATACTATGMRAPLGVWSDGTKIYATSANSLGGVVGYRVMIWSAFPTSHGASASAVLGQANLTTCASQTASASSLNVPTKIFGFGTKLAVADFSNNRILIWNTLPTLNNTPADLVLGQTSFTGATATAGTQFGLSGPAGVWMDGSSLMVADKNNRSLRLWKQFPTANGQTYDSVNVWLCTSTDSWCQSGAVPSVSSAASVGATSAIMVGNKLVAADAARHRVLVWNTFPTASNTAADVVIGQSNFTVSNPNGNNLEFPTSSSLWNPNKLATDGTRLFVVDNKNNRVLVWNTLPTSNNTAADLVLGQPNFSTRDSNPNGTLSAADFNGPASVAVSGSKLIVADPKNNRVLIWNTLPTASYVAADVILGQTTASGRIENRGGSTSAGTLYRIDSWENDTLSIKFKLHYL